MNLKRIDGTYINLLDGLDDIEQARVRMHFNNPNSYAQVVLDQLNKSNIYDDVKNYIGKSKLSVVFDVGANIGLFSLFIAPVCDKVVAFEPTFSHFELLQILLKNYPNCVPVNEAIGLSVGKVGFVQNPQNTTMNHIELNNRVTVDCTTLGAAREKYGHPNFCKVDIEGFENELIHHLGKDGVWCQPDSLFIEVHGDYHVGRERWAQELKRRGYYTKPIGIDALFADQPF